MGILDDFSRLTGAAQTPRYGLSEGLKRAADAAEGARRLQDAGVPDGVNGMGFNPFENAGAMASLIPGAGTVVSLVDTGERFDAATIYDVTFEIVADGMAGFQVVHRQMIAAAALGNWQPGKTLPVRFDPADHARFMVG